VIEAVEEAVEVVAVDAAAETQAQTNQEAAMVLIDHRVAVETEAAMEVTEVAVEAMVEIEVAVEVMVETEVATVATEAAVEVMVEIEVAVVVETSEVEDVAEDVEAMEAHPLITPNHTLIPKSRPSKQRTLNNQLLSKEMNSYSRPNPDKVDKRSAF